MSAWGSLHLATRLQVSETGRMFGGGRIDVAMWTLGCAAGRMPSIIGLVQNSHIPAAPLPPVLTTGGTKSATSALPASRTN